MARGVAKSLEEKIADIEAKKTELQARIDSYKEKISDLDKQIKTLRNERQQEEMEKLLGAIQKSGKTIEEVLDAVSIKK